MDTQVSMPPPPPPPPPFLMETTTPQLTVPPPPPPPQPVTTTATVTASVVSPSTQDRIWLHPWTAAEMRENASQWSLAGDAGLLLYLEQFSDKLVQRADAIQQHLNQTVNAVKSTHTRVQNCLNEFTSLANTQFIENRVYDEDETVNNTASKKDEQSTEKSNVSNTEAQEKVLQRYVEAIQFGLSILETHFERVEAKLDTIQNGSSSFVDDDEDDGVPIEPILEPKDPYIFRPLPHLIGTTEFMQDDYVGLGDLLTIHDEDYNAEEIVKEESDSVLLSSDEEVDEFVVQQGPPMPLVPAGASRPDHANLLQPPPPTTTLLTDSDDDEDPFGMNTGPKFDVFSTTKPTEDKDLFGEIKPPIKAPPKTQIFAEDEDHDDEKDMFGIAPKKPPPKTETFAEEEDHDDETGIFGIAPKKPPPTSIEQKKDDFDSESLSSKESDEPPPPVQQKQHVGQSMLPGGLKGMSELEKRVLARRRAMGDPDVPPESDEDNTEKPTKTSNATIASPVIKTTTKPSSDEPSSSTISKLTSTPLTTTEKISKPSIFGKSIASVDDDADDFFNDAPKQIPTFLPTTTSSTSSTIIPPKKEKDIFDDNTDEEDDPFKPPKPKNIPPSKPVAKTDPTQKIQPPVIRPRIPSGESDEDDIFQTIKKTPPKPIAPPSTTSAITKPKSPSSEDDLFTAKPPSTAAAKISDDDAPLFDDKPSVQPPAAKLPVKTSAPLSDDDSEDEMFGLTKNKPKGPIAEQPKVVPSTKPDVQDASFGIPTAKPIIPTTETKTIIPPVKSIDDDDDEDELFKSSTNKSKVQTTKIQKPDTTIDSGPLKVNLPPLPTLLSFPSAPTDKTDFGGDPLGLAQPVKTTSQPSIAKPVKPASVPTIQPTKSSLSDSDENEDSSQNKINPEALKEGEKRGVKDIASKLNIVPNAFGPRGARKPTPVVIEESPKPSIDDDDQPVQTTVPPPTITKKLPELDPDDSDEDLFQTTKKITPPAKIIERQNTTNTENENGKDKFKNISSRLGANLSMLSPSTPQKPTSSHEENKAISKEISKEEPAADPTMLTIAKDRARVGAKNRAPPSRKPRSTGTAAAVSANENDDLFALPPSTNTTTSSPPLPQVTAPPPAPVTGLPNNTAAITAKSNKRINPKEKKKFSLFDSDDSDTDELLFGSNKKNKTPVVSKPTTTPVATSKATTKPAILSLDDDDNDFLSKRPVKKSTKPVGNDDIFADVQGNSQQTNKAKKDWSIMNKSATDDQDDIFNDSPSKSSAKTNAKGTNIKNKSNKDIDDIFDDPLNIKSKR